MLLVVYHRIPHVSLIFFVKAPVYKEKVSSGIFSGISQKINCLHSNCEYITVLISCISIGDIFCGTL